MKSFIYSRVMSYLNMTLDERQTLKEIEHDEFLDEAVKLAKIEGKRKDQIVFPEASNLKNNQA